MKSYLRTIIALVTLSSISGFADTPAKLTGFPFQDETLQFNVNWPTGVSLGKASMQARRIEDERWELLFTLDASIPGFTITDKYKSIATRDLCSVEFERESTHGAKKTRETVKFQSDRHTAHRVTTGGGSSDYRIPDCAKDALNTNGAEGIWSGIFIPPLRDWRGRNHCAACLLQPRVAA